MRDTRLLAFVVLVLGYVALAPLELLAQVVAGGSDGAATTPSESSILSQIALAGYVAMKLESLKNSSTFKWITPYTEQLTKVWAALAGLVSAVGITWAFERDISGYGTLVFSNIPVTWDTLWAVGKTAVEQYWATKLIYLGTIKPNATITPPAAPVDVT